MSQIQPPSPVPDDNRREQVLLPIVGGVRELLFGAPNFVANRPGFIAGPDPQSGLANAVQKVARFNCRQWARSPKGNYSPAVNQGNADLCGPYLADIGEQPAPGFLGPEFLGGQCAGTYYFVTMRFYNATTGAVTGTTGYEGFGPVTIGTEGNQAPGPGNPSPGPGFTYYPGKTLVFNGVPRIALGGVWAVRQPWEIVSIVPRGSEPNNCGNPSPVLRPPSQVVGPPLPPVINIDIPGFGPVNVNVNLDPDGNPIICIPDLEVCVTVEPPGGEGGGGGGGGGSGGEDGPGEPGDPSDTGEGGEAEGEADEGEVLTGLKIDFVQPPVGGKEYVEGVYRGVCYIYMGTSEGLDHDPAGAMLRDGQFVFAEKPYLTHWRVSANMGYSLRVTPYYRPIEAEEN